MITSGRYDVGTEMNAYCELRTAAHAEFEKASRVYANLVEQNNKALSGDLRSGGLDQKTKVLLLVAMHVASGSRQSVEFSVSAAVQVGAKQEEVLDAIDMALLTRGGQAVANAQLAFQILHAQIAGGEGISAAAKKPNRFAFVSQEATNKTAGRK